LKTLTPSFRWYGPQDPVRLSDIRQCGATHIVTALHHIPNGAIWSPEEIRKRQLEVEKAGLTWSVVESLPVSEAIKTRSGNFKGHLEHYKISLRNLAQAGIRIITYNFMPVLDWTRTNLDYHLNTGVSTLRFDLGEVAFFDLYLLKRKGAESDYSQEILKKAEKLNQELPHTERQRIESNVIKGLPGAEEGYSLDAFRKALAPYQDLEPEGLRSNLIRFLEEICPVAEEGGQRLVVHPDDPPFHLFGLPRVVSTQEDLQSLFDRVPSAANGLCFCTGSLGVRADNDLPAMARLFAPRVHFLHLRSTQRDEAGNFFEANHLEGDAQIPNVLDVFIRENQKRKEGIPFRPDHGYKMLDDQGKDTLPGYSCIGRMKGLAEIRGLEKGIMVSMDEPNE